RKARAAREREMTEQEVVQAVERAVKEVLGMGEGEKVDESVALRELGFDSVTSVELRDKIAKELGLELSATLLFDYPTLKALRAKVGEEMGVSKGEERGTRRGVAGKRVGGMGSAG